MSCSETDIPEEELAITKRLEREKSARVLAEKELETKSILFRALMDATPDFIVFKDTDFVYRAVNVAFITFLNRPETEILGKSDFDLFPKQEAEQYRWDDSGVLETGIPIVQDEYVTGARGRTWLQVARAPVRNPDGSLRGLLLTVRDISDHKRIEQSFQEERNRLIGILGALNVPVLMLSENGLAEYKNTAAEAAFPEGTLDAPALLATQDGLWHCKRSGHTYHVFTAIIPTARNSTALLKVLQDVTWDVERRREHQITRAKLAAVVEASKDAIVGTNLHGNVISWNAGAERMYGYKAPEVKGRSFLKVCRRDELDATRQLLEQAENGTPIGPIEQRRVCKDGSLMTVLSTFSPIMGESGGVIGLSIVEQDIEERKRAEEELLRYSQELQEMNNDLESFSYSVSHDLRQPLRAIDGYVHILEEDLAACLDESGRGFMRSIHRNVIRMAELIDDLLAFSRAGRVKIQLDDIDMGRLVREVIDATHEKERQKVTFVIDPALPRASGDISLIKVVLTNLIENAVKFSRARERPEVEIGYKEQLKAFFVRDNGTGFDPQYIGRLFRLFERLHNEGEYEGTGVGLSIVQRIIKRHNGDVWAEGKEDQGATLYFTLPLTVPAVPDRLLTHG